MLTSKGILDAHSCNRSLLFKSHDINSLGIRKPNETKAP